MFPGTGHPVEFATYDKTYECEATPGCFNQLNAIGGNGKWKRGNGKW